MIQALNFFIKHKYKKIKISRSNSIYHAEHANGNSIKVEIDCDKKFSDITKQKNVKVFVNNVIFSVSTFKGIKDKVSSIMFMLDAAHNHITKNL